MTLAIGLISGTSVDGIDAALVELRGTDIDLNLQFIGGATYPYPASLRLQILAVAGGEKVSPEELAQLDDAIATQFALAASSLQQQYGLKVDLIGSHGQTIFHRPPQNNLGYSWQLGRGELIADLTKTPTVTNFRAGDIAVGGQGAPLVSRIDAYLLAAENHSRCVQNLGGIGNVTYLPPRQQRDWEAQIIGWDTGPGNILIDLAVSALTKGEKTYDRNGEWAAQGTPHLVLVEKWLQEEFFRQPPPKSTGRELFGKEYLERCWQDAQPYNLNEADWLATLTELTATSIAHNYQTFLPHPPDEVLLCGGGSHNLYLQKRIRSHLTPAKVLTTDSAGLNSDYKEAIAFAILGYWRYQGCCPGNLPQVTGAKSPVPLGVIHYPIS